jgi:hypothetical protein
MSRSTKNTKEPVDENWMSEEEEWAPQESDSRQPEVREFNNPTDSEPEGNVWQQACETEEEADPAPPRFEVDRSMGQIRGENVFGPQVENKKSSKKEPEISDLDDPDDDEVIILPISTSEAQIFETLDIIEQQKVTAQVLQESKSSKSKNIPKRPGVERGDWQVSTHGGEDSGKPASKPPRPSKPGTAPPRSKTSTVSSIKAKHLPPSKLKKVPDEEDEEDEDESTRIQFESNPRRGNVLIKQTPAKKSSSSASKPMAAKKSSSAASAPPSAPKPMAAKKSSSAASAPPFAPKPMAAKKSSSAASVPVPSAKQADPFSSESEKSDHSGSESDHHSSAASHSDEEEEEKSSSSEEETKEEAISTMISAEEKRTEELILAKMDPIFPLDDTVFPENGFPFEPQRNCLFSEIVYESEVQESLESWSTMCSQVMALFRYGWMEDEDGKPCEFVFTDFAEFKKQLSVFIPVASGISANARDDLCDMVYHNWRVVAMYLTSHRKLHNMKLVPTLVEKLWKLLPSQLIEEVEGWPRSSSTKKPSSLECVPNALFRLTVLMVMKQCVYPPNWFLAPPSRLLEIEETYSGWSFTIDHVISPFLVSEYGKLHKKEVKDLRSRVDSDEEWLLKVWRSMDMILTKNTHETINTVAIRQLFAIHRLMSLLFVDVFGKIYTWSIHGPRDKFPYWATMVVLLVRSRSFGKAAGCKESIMMDFAKHCFQSLYVHLDEEDREPYSKSHMLMKVRDQLSRGRAPKEDDSRPTDVQVTVVAKVPAKRSKATKKPAIAHKKQQLYHASHDDHEEEGEKDEEEEEAEEENDEEEVMETLVTSSNKRKVATFLPPALTLDVPKKKKKLEPGFMCSSSNCKDTRCMNSACSTFVASCLEAMSAKVKKGNMSVDQMQDLFCQFIPMFKQLE